MQAVYKKIYPYISFCCKNGSRGVLFFLNEKVTAIWELRSEDIESPRKTRYPVFLNNFYSAALDISIVPSIILKVILIRIRVSHFTSKS